MLVLPSDHRLAARKTIALDEVAGDPFINVSATAPALRAVIDDYLRHSQLKIAPAHEADNLAMAISLVASTRGVALLPRYAQNFLPWSVISRPIKGKAPTIDLVVGHHAANASPILKFFLSKLDELIRRVASR
jgi:LysR family hca operon transcriptional activator